ncbi:MAG: formate dehydrogenase, partial [Calditrichaeota bacterium]
LGTNHIDNSARVCHAPSTTALKQSIGYAATTCSYKDMIGTDLLVFFGSNPANNQPVVMKYLHLAKKQGTKVAMINCFREPGMAKYWVPSIPSSALLGTRITDFFFKIQPGGDIAFINGVLKHLIDNDWIDKNFILHHTSHWEELTRLLEQQSFDELEKLAGCSREEMLNFARIYSKARSAIFVWSMGITMHRFGVENVKSIVNLALSRGMIGKPYCGLMAIRGHSGVQGGAEMGAVPNQFPGGVPINATTAKEFSRQWGFPVPDKPGLFAAEMIDAAHQGELELLYSAGSNLFNILPDSQYVKEALTRIPIRVHHDIVLNPQMFIPNSEMVLILPATTRYEMKGGNTETTTERRVIFNPEIPGPRIALAKDEWRFLVKLAQRLKPEYASCFAYPTTAAIREEIARIIPLYNGIQHLSKKGDNFQWGGERLGENFQFPTGDGKAHFSPLSPPVHHRQSGWFSLSTRRGKQFNSITFSNKDPLLNNGRRNEFWISSEDMKALGLKEGNPVRLRNSTGSLVGILRVGEVTPGVIMVYWPEANVLVPRGVCDPQCGIPAYRDAQVEIISLSE